MRTTRNLLFGLLLATAAAFGQATVALTQTGSLSASGSTCSSTNCLQINITSLTGAVGIGLAGTFSATVTFEVSVDGTNWVAAAAAPPPATEARTTTATAAGVWQMNVAGYSSMRVRCSTYSSGTITVTLKRSGVSPGNGA